MQFSLDRFRFNPLVLWPTLLVFSALNVARAGGVWPPPQGVPMTRWGKTIKADEPVWPEYPRPQMTRTLWMNLNGPWDYAITDKGASVPSSYDGHILVPFCVESVLSQVNQRVTEKNQIWYHRTFQIPRAWSGQRVLLHFGAVDWETTVTVNGKEMGRHRGGYDAFDFDVTDALKPQGAQELVVSAWNPIEGGQPRGKQARRPSGIFYTPTTGIWQTVWLEPVPQSHIDKLKMVTDVDAGRLRLIVYANQESADQQSVEVSVLDAGKVVARAKGKTGVELDIPIPEAKIWWPESPFLYDLHVTLKEGRKKTDAVAGYFGMRKISLGPDENGNARILLNNKFVFQNGLLDQGFWPDGIYTAPTDAALRSDIETAKELGFNMLRKHIKVEPDRWYYWADKLGMLVWQDMPACMELGKRPRPEYIADMEGEYELELRRMIEGRFNHPSIVMWNLFNEGWGLSVQRKDGREVMTDESRAREERMTKAAREEDATRLINSESGAGGTGREGLYDCGLGDIQDYHAYGKQIPPPEKNRALVLGEYGWGASAEDRVVQFLKSLEHKDISGMVLTQLTDVETENNNGRLRYDRTLKGNVPAEKIGPKLIEAIHQAGYFDYPGGGETAPKR